MRVLVIGSGGREHALVWKIAQSPLVTEIYAWPGNPGMEPLAHLVTEEVSDPEFMAGWAQKTGIDLTVVGPEDPLVEGIVDIFVDRTLRIFGPSSGAARLEGSKAFAKDVARQAEIPIPWYRTFDKADEAMTFVHQLEGPAVVKADGLAAGKGVVVAADKQETLDAVRGFMKDDLLGEAGRRVVIEEKLEGEEVSFLVLTDGENIIPLVSSQDHKAIFDGDRGPNTGGMGAYSPAPVADSEAVRTILDRVILPAVRTMREMGSLYRGVLYAGLMMTREGPKLLEFNCRFGDPETQVILPRMESDLVPLLTEVADGKLETVPRWKNQAALGVVLASHGYPGKPRKGDPIRGLDEVTGETDILAFHAGTARQGQEWVTAGGRVLCLTALAPTLKEAQARAYQGVSRISFRGMQYRKDIGYRALTE